MTGAATFSKFLDAIDANIVQRLSDNTWDEHRTAQVRAAIEGLAAVRSNFDSLEKAYGADMMSLEGVAGFVGAAAKLEHALRKFAAEPCPGFGVVAGAVPVHLIGRAVRGSDDLLH